MTEDEEKEKERYKLVCEELAQTKQLKEVQRGEEEKVEVEFRIQKNSIDDKRINKYLEQERQGLDKLAEPIK